MTTSLTSPFQANADGYWQLYFRLHRDSVLSVENAWMEAGALSVTIESFHEFSQTHPEQAGDVGLIEQAIFAEPSALGQLPNPADITDPTILWDDCVINVLLAHDANIPTLMLQALANGADETVFLHREWVGSKDWLASVQASFQPIILNRVAVLAHWHEAPKDKMAIWIDPGQAFGSGAHQTTKMMLSWIETNHLQGKRLIDYGCGSGILAIGAAKMGARAYATDIDSIAMQVTIDNTAQNDIHDDQCHVCPAETLMRIMEKNPADILLANILLQPLMQLAQDFHALLKEGGQLLMTGVLVEQLEMLQSCYDHSAGWSDFHIVESQEGWALVKVIKSNHRD